jgi:predicted alpha-1,2-mannosidase
MKNHCRFILWLFCFLASTAQAHAGDSTSTRSGPKAGELGRNVNPFIGTGGVSYLCGNLSPGATLPFGMVRLSPDTVSNNGRRATNLSGYYYRDNRILGFSHTRLSGTGACDGGNFLVVPVAGTSNGESPVSESLRRGLNATFSHKHETAFPGYYAVASPDLGLFAELTATRRVGVHRYTFSKEQTPRLLINVTNALGRGKSKEAQVRVLPQANEVEGSVRTFGTFSGRYGGVKVYFVARTNQPIATFATWMGKTLVSDHATAAGDDIGVDLAFKKNGSPAAVELKLAISYVSIQNARANLDAEAGAANFDDVLAKARDEWEEKLSRIRVEGGTDKQRTIFYTSLYHSLLMPTLFSDVNGEYLGFDLRVHHADGFNYYTDMSLWDTFRTTHPLFTWMAPREQRDFVVSLVQMAKQGGYLPRWPSGNGYTNSMFGTPADNVVAETYLKGIRDFDVETAYQAMRKTALGPTKNSRFSGRSGIEDYLKFGYCPADRMRQSVARTLEYASSDHAIARLAEALGHHEDVKLFDKHAQFYRNLWNPKTQYFQPRNSNGEFDPAFRPLLLTYLDASGAFTHAYVEGSAEQWRWAVPHDTKGLVSLFKNRDYFVQELDSFFKHSVPDVGRPPNAYYWHGNQPDIYAAFLFNAADRPDLTQKWSRWILDFKYGDQENGLDGNDDGGTLSAWYVLASLGLYPTAGTTRYQIASPIWTRAEVKTGDQRFTIVADGTTPKNVYVQKASLDGTHLDRSWLDHKEIARRGELHFVMGPTPPQR